MHFEDAEKSVIGSMILSEKALSVIPLLSEDDFYSPTFRRMFRAIKNLHASHNPVDLLTVDNETKGELVNELIECSRFVPSAANVEAYADIVRESADMRRAVAIAEGVIRSVQGGESSALAIIDRARQQFRDMTRLRNEWQSLESAMGAAYLDLSNRSVGKIKPIVTDLPDIDRHIGGFFPGELTIIGARPSVGKSAFALFIALNAARQGKKVCFVSLEMSAIQLSLRIIASSGINGMKLRKADIEADEWGYIADAISEHVGLPISIATSIRTIEDLRAEIQSKIELSECELLIIDYLQLMHTQHKYEADHIRVAAISKALKEITLDFGIPVIALAQVKRFQNNGKSRMPVLEDLKDSGSIEQDADNCMFLHRPDDADDPTIAPEDASLLSAAKKQGMQYIVVNIAKQRQGYTGMKGILFEPARMRYRCISRDA